MPRSALPSGPLENAVLLTVLYSDLFDYALTEEDLRHYLVVAAEAARLRKTVDHLSLSGWLERHDGHVVWEGRRELVALRRERAERSLALWSQAQEVASRLAEVPFVRMVGVCGSLAVENVPEHGDVDLFLVTENDRLWIAQWQAMRLRRRVARRGIDACPNYLVTLDNLEVRRRDLHTAREIAHVVPLWGGDVYDRFLAANRWIFDLLPNLDLADRRRYLREGTQTRNAERWERRLRGRFGNALDRSLHRLLLLYYPWRLRSRGVRGRQIRSAYQRNRQEVVGGGYAAAIRERFHTQVRERLGDQALQMVEELLFPSNSLPNDPVPLYDQQLSNRYGRPL